MLAEILGVVGVFGSSLLSAMHFYNPWGLNFHTIFVPRPILCNVLEVISLAVHNRIHYC